MKHLFHVYDCQDCILTFAVEQTFEDLAEIGCPLCGNEDYLRDVASGDMEIKLPPGCNQMVQLKIITYVHFNAH